MTEISKIVEEFIHDRHDPNLLLQNLYLPYFYLYIPFSGSSLSNLNISTYGDLPYTTQSVDVGIAVTNYDPETDPRKPWELGFGHYFQGDIILRPDQYKQQNALPYTSTNRWINGTIPYVISGSFCRSKCIYSNVNILY